MSNVAVGSAAVAAGLGAALLGLAATGLGLAGRLNHWMRYTRQLTFMMAAAVVVAVVVMERALITRDFTVKFVAENGSSTTPPVFNVATLWSALEGSILLWALVLCGYSVAVAIRFRGRGPDDPMMAWAMLVMLRGERLLPRAHGGAGRSLHRGGRPARLRRPRPQPAAAEPHPDGVPSADPLPRLCGVHSALRLRGGRAGHRPPRGGMAGRHPALDGGRLGFPDVRHRARRLVELRDARLGRVLGLGPGGERLVPAVADRHRLPALGDGAGAARDSAGLEPVAGDRHLLADNPGHVPDPLGGAGLGPLLHRVGHRPGHSRLLRGDRGRVAGPDRLAGRPAAHSGPDRGAGLAGGRLPGQQRPVRRVRVRGAARHGVPAAGRSLRRTDDLGGQPLLRPDDPAHRLRAAVPDGGGAHAALGRDVAPSADGAAEPSPAGADVGRVRRPRAGCGCRRAGGGRRCWPSAWAASRAGPRCGSSSWPCDGTAGGAWWAGPTAA